MTHRLSVASLAWMIQLDHNAMFGSHLSVAGGLHHALTEARSLDMDCVQIFTKNQRQWKAKALTKQQIAQWHQSRAETGIDQVVSHDSYLINLASPDTALRRNSIALFREELVRCEALGIPFLVTHPGAHMGAGEEAGLTRVAGVLNRVHKDLAGLSVVTCLEVTAGQGTSLGHRFEHLRRIIESVSQPERLAVCLDTAHMLAAGYDLTSGTGCRAMLAELDHVIGLKLVGAIHLNDSKVPRGKRVDRHDHIGRGHVSLEAFAVMVNHRMFKSVPKILETPKADAPDGRPWDVVNLEVLRGLVRRRRPPTKTKKKKHKPRLTGRRRRKRM